MTRFIAKDYVTLRAREEDGRQDGLDRDVRRPDERQVDHRPGARRKDGTLRVSGAAWTQGSLKSVELRIDDGPWDESEAGRTHKDPHTWTFWTYEWKDPTPGEHTLVSRATDEQGRVQPTADDPEIRLKKTYWEAYATGPRAH